MLVPLIVVFGLGLSANYTQWVLAAYAVQTVIWLLFYGRAGVVLPVGWALVGVLVSVSYVLSLFASGDSYGALNAMDVADAVARVMGFVLCVGLASSLRLQLGDLDRFFWFLVMVGVGSVFAALILSPPSGNILGSVSSYAWNFSAFFGSRNQLGGYLFVAIAALLLVRSNFRWRGIFLLVFCFLIMGLLLTMSRTAIGATLVMLIVYLVVQAPRTRLLMFILGALGIGAYVKADALLWAQVDRAFVRSEVGLTGRDVLWDYGFQFFHESPIFGVGGFQAVERAQGAGMVNDQFHSFYVETLAAGGVVGLMVHGGIILFVFWRVLRAWRQRESGADLFVAAFAGLLFMMSFESVSFFSIGYVDTLFTIFFVFVPLAVFSSGTKVVATNPGLPVAVEVKDRVRHP